MKVRDLIKFLVDQDVNANVVFWPKGVAVLMPAIEDLSEDLFQSDVPGLLILKLREAN